MQLRLLKKLFVAAMIGASFTAIPAHADDLLDQVKQRGTLRVGLEGTFPPFNSKAPSGELSAMTSTSRRLSRRSSA